MIAVSTMPSCQSGDREADAVQRDGTFHGDVTREFRRNFHAEPPIRAFGFESRYATNSIDMALHEVAAEFFHRGQRALEVDAHAGLHVAKAGAAQRFAGKIGGESGGGNIDGGEAAAVDGDAAGFFEAEDQRPGIHADGRADLIGARDAIIVARANVAQLDGFDGANVLNDSCKHRGDTPRLRNPVQTAAS